VVELEVDVREVEVVELDVLELVDGTLLLVEVLVLLVDVLELEVDVLEVEVLVLLVVVAPPSVVVVVGTGTSDVVVVAGSGPITSATHWSIRARACTASPTVRQDGPGSSFANLASRMPSRFTRQLAMGAAPRRTPVRWQRIFARTVAPLVFNFAPVQTLASGWGRSAPRRPETHASTAAATRGASPVVRQPPLDSARSTAAVSRPSARP